MNTKSNQYNLFINENSMHLSLDDKESENLLQILLILFHIPGIGIKTIQNLYENILESTLKIKFNSDHTHINKVIESIFLNYDNKDSERIKTKILKGINNSIDKGYESYEELQNSGINFIPLGHVEYPKNLLRLENPPKWIFIKGNKSLLNSDSNIAVVGTRTPTINSKLLTTQITSYLVENNFVIVSGLARGIDEASHKAVVNNYGQTVGVLGQSINSKLNLDLQELELKILECDGAIISEYFPSLIPNKDSFLRRNEIIVALSKLLLPIEISSLKSGTAATIRRAKKIDTEVLSFKYNTSVKNIINSYNILKELDCKILKISSSNFHEFENFLKDFFKNHNFTPNYEQRQELLFKNLLKTIRLHKEKMNIDNKSIENFISFLKNTNF